MVLVRLGLAPDRCEGGAPRGAVKVVRPVGRSTLTARRVARFGSDEVQAALSGARGRGPQLGGAPGGEDLGAVGAAGGVERSERLFDVLAWLVAGEEVA